VEGEEGVNEEEKEEGVGRGGVSKVGMVKEKGGCKREVK
jgi:hypothetical protein